MTNSRAFESRIGLTRCSWPSVPLDTFGGGVVELEIFDSLDDGKDRFKVPVGRQQIGHLRA